MRKNYYHYHFDKDNDDVRCDREIVLKDDGARSPTLSRGSEQSSERYSDFGGQGTEGGEYYLSDYQDEQQGQVPRPESREMSVGSPASEGRLASYEQLGQGDGRGQGEGSPATERLSRQQRRTRNRKRIQNECSDMIANLEAEVATLKLRVAEEHEVRVNLGKLLRATQERRFINAFLDGDEPLDQAMMVLRVGDDQGQPASSPYSERILWLPTLEQDFNKLVNFAEALAISRNKYSGQMISDQLAALVIKANSVSKDSSKEEVTLVTVHGDTYEEPPMTQTPLTATVEVHRPSSPFQDTADPRQVHGETMAKVQTPVDLRSKVDELRAARPRKMARRTVVMVPNEQETVEDIHGAVPSSAVVQEQDDLLDDPTPGLPKESSLSKDRRLMEKKPLRRGLKRSVSDKTSHQFLDDESAEDQLPQRCTRSGGRRDKQLLPVPDDQVEISEAQAEQATAVEVFDDKEENVVLRVCPEDTDFAMG